MRCGRCWKISLRLTATVLERQNLTIVLKASILAADGTQGNMAARLRNQALNAIDE